MGIEDVTGCYKGLQGVRGGGLHGVTRGYKSLEGLREKHFCN